jgi:hypothetical protein
MRWEHTLLSVVYDYEKRTVKATFGDQTEEGWGSIFGQLSKLGWELVSVVPFAWRTWGTRKAGAPVGAFQFLDYGIRDDASVTEYLLFVKRPAAAEESERG